MTPTRALVISVCALAVVAALDFAARLLDVGNGVAYIVWLYGAGALLAVAIADIALSRKVPSLSIRRQIDGNLALGQWRPVSLHVASSGGVNEQLEVFDLVPMAFEFRGLPRQLLLPAHAQAEIVYDIQPQRRGTVDFDAVHVRWRSRLGLFAFDARVPVATQVRVYPDFSWLQRYLRLATQRRAATLGVHLQPRRGQGLEFLQLREYRPSDMVRQVDWKATSRRRQLISREYHEEQDQQILFVLDTGRRMRASDGLASHFDEALKAMLLLAWVALRQGDAVGLQSTGAQPRSLPMQRGAAAINVLLHAVYDLDTDTSASDYLAAARAIGGRQQRRALIVWLTNLQDEDDDVLPALELLAARHIVLVTSLQESVVDAISQQPVRGIDDALRAAAVSRHVAQRRAMCERVKRAGHVVLDCTPAELPVRLVNDYWRLKRSGRL